MNTKLICLLFAALVLCLSCGVETSKSASVDAGSDMVIWPVQDTRIGEIRPRADVTETNACVDNDGDGYGIDCPKGPDCNDSIKSCHVDCETDTDENGVPDCEETDCPGTDEIPYNGIDDDCDPFTTDSDVDKDGYDAFAMGGGDCDDSNPQVNPGAQELCGDWLDNNCDGFPIPASNQPECPQGQMCNLQTGQCEDDPDCNGCPMGQVCQNGECVVDATCYGGCPPGHDCVPESGLCLVAGCLKDGCPEDGKNWACNPYTGVCYISSCQGGCPQGQLCNPETGACYVDANCGGDCMMNEVCNKYTGSCEPNPLCPNDFCLQPAGMVRVQGPGVLYYMDMYEWPNIQGQGPTGNMGSKNQVREMCLSKAKRLCSVEELSAACDGVVGNGGTKFPYANTGDAYSYDPTACNTEQFESAASGSYPQCHNEAFMAFDLVGNLAEWTEDGVLFGGSYEDGAAGTCTLTFQPSQSDIKAYGFRCCLSPSNDLDNDGFNAAQDCDDSNDDIYPGASEECNGQDDNCDGVVDEGPDNDGDGYSFCEDCNDDKYGIHPGAEDEVGDGVDQNCDGVDGVDADGDSQASVESGGEDCNDTDDISFVGAADSFGDGVDQNCDEFDGVDLDGDKHASNAPAESPDFDCNDGDASVYSGAPDTVGDQKDQNCDAADGVDADGDGQASEASGGKDCNDTNGAVFYDCIGKECGDDGCAGSCGACNNEDLCDGEETCENSQCASGTALDCDDGNACTSDTCKPDTGCSSIPTNEGGACVTSAGQYGTCAAGLCTDCIADGDCNDEDACTTNEKCFDGVCNSQGSLDCDDGNLCTDDSCDPVIGCKNTPLIGDPCVFDMMICELPGKCGIDGCSPLPNCQCPNCVTCLCCGMFELCID